MNNRFPNILPIHSNIDWDGGILMKAFSLCVESKLQEDNHINRMKLYIDIVCELNICSIIVFANVASILSKEEFKELCFYSLIRDVNIVCLEQSMSKNYLNEYCYGLYIDEDYDEFYIVKGEMLLV